MLTVSHYRQALLQILGGVPFDTSTASGCKLASNIYTLSIAVGSGSNRALFVGVACLTVGGSVSSVSSDVGGVLTKVRADVDASTLARSEIWKLVAPAAGTHTLTVTLSGAIDSEAVAISYFGTDQTDPVDAQTGSNGVGGTPTSSITPNSNNTWLLDVVATANKTMVVSPGQTQRWNVACTGGSGTASDKGMIATPASTAMSWAAVGVTDVWAQSVIAIKPFVASAGPITHFQTVSVFGSWAATTTRLSTYFRAVLAAGTWAALSTRLATYYRTSAVAATWTATVSRLATYYRVLTASGTWTALVVRLSTYFRSLSVVGVWTATTSRLSTFFLTLSVAGAWSAVATRTATYFRSVAASGTWTALSTKITIFVRSLTASGTWTATVGRALVFIRTVAASAAWAALVTSTVSFSSLWTFIKTVLGLTPDATATCILRTTVSGTIPDNAAPPSDPTNTVSGSVDNDTTLGP